MESQWKGLTWGKGSKIKFASTDKFTWIGVRTADWRERYEKKFREIRSGLQQTSRQGESLVVTEEMEENVSDSVQEKDLGGCDRTRAYDQRGRVTCLPMDCDRRWCMSIQVEALKSQLMCDCPHLLFPFDWHLSSFQMLATHTSRVPRAEEKWRKHQMTHWICSMGWKSTSDSFFSPLTMPQGMQDVIPQVRNLACFSGSTET